MPEPPNNENLKDSIRKLKTSYYSEADDLASDFFEPCLGCFSSYNRAAGYFSSSALRSWASAMRNLVDSPEASIKLLISPELPEDDVKALKSVVDERACAKLLTSGADAFVERALMWSEATDLDNQDCADFLAWLIATDRLELRFAFNLNDGKELGIFHKKIGTFTFPWGDQIAFTGSANESWSAHSINSESLDVFRSWDPADARRLADKIEEFQVCWEARTDKLTVWPLSNESLAKIKSYSRDNPPSWIAGKPAAAAHPPLQPEEQGLWPHQIDALTRFRKIGSGVLEMATGTGKTRTALAILRWLFRTRRIESAVITMAGTDLIAQWEKDIRQTLTADLRLALCRAWGSVHAEEQHFIMNPAGKILLCSREKLKKVYKQFQKHDSNISIGLVHDEVHDLGSASNCEHLAGHKEFFVNRLGLSATPERDYDDAGNQFIEDEIGPVIFQYNLESAIRNGRLCPFEYFPIPYQLTDQDKRDKAAVHSRKSAAAKSGEPWPPERLWIELGKINKKARAKPPRFAEFLDAHSEDEFLRSSIIFVEDTEFSSHLYDILIRHTHKYNQYFSEDISRVLERFSKGELECLVTCYKLSQGIDIKSLRTVMLFSSQRGKRETIQRLGRCLRIDSDNPGKIARVIDFYEADDAGHPLDDRIDGTNRYRSADTERFEWLRALSSMRRD